MKRTAVITGGGQGIGKAISKHLLDRNMKVAIIDIDDEAGNETLNEFKHPVAVFIRADISDEQDVKTAIEGASAALGRIDNLINNAAVSSNKPLEELTLSEWNRVINVNLTGAFLMTKYCIGHLKKNKGSVVNICSTRAFMSEKDTEAYSASKGGIYSLTHALAVSLGPDVRVNSISPGWIDVSGLKKSRIRIQETISDSDNLQHPAGRIGNAFDVAAMVLFLISPENSFITGQDFIIDGGMTKKMIYIEQ